MRANNVHERVRLHGPSPVFVPSQAEVFVERHERGRIVVPPFHEFIDLLDVGVSGDALLDKRSKHSFFFASLRPSLRLCEKTFTSPPPAAPPAASPAPGSLRFSSSS